MENRCLYLTKTHELYIKNGEAPVCGDDEVLIRVKAAGICGSDIHYYKEGGLAHHEVQDDYIPGHEAAGLIVEVGKNVKDRQAGQKVCIEPGVPCRTCRTCEMGRYNLCENLHFISMPGITGETRIDGAFQDYIAVRADMAHVLPETMDFELGAQVEPVAVALHTVRRAGMIRGKSVAVLGVGPIGMLVVKILKASGVGELTYIDINEERLELAKKNGADRVINPKKEGFPKEIADIAIEAAGSPITTSELVHVARSAGTIVSVGWPVGNMVTFDMGVFIIKELQYFGSYNYCMDFDTAIRFLDKKIIDTSDWVTHHFKFDDFVEGFIFTAEHPQEVIKTIIHYD